MSPSLALAATALTKTFGQNAATITALKGVDLDLCAGEFTLLMGPSGSGKSSLLAALGGLQAPDSGSVIYGGEDIWAGPSAKLREYRRLYCGFVFQTVGLFASLPALAQVILPLTLSGMSQKDATIRAEQALDEVGLLERAHSRPSELSGGQNQRIAIARMLSKSPKLIFCDEPTSALDKANGVLVAQLLSEAASKRQAMILCVSHDDRLRPYADRVIEIEDGALTSDMRGPGGALC